MRMILYEPGDKFLYPRMQYVSKEEDDHNLECIDRKLQIYRSGKYFISYLFGGLTEALVAEMKENVRNALDNLVVIWGSEGVGKSHLAHHIATQFNPSFDMKKNYIYKYEEFLKRITEDLDSPPGTVYWLDEASNIAGNRDWMHKDNKEFIKILEMFRSKGWTLIMCIPDIERLDVYIRETRVRYILKAAYMSWDFEKKPKARGYFSLTRVDFTDDYISKKKIGYGKFPPMPEDVAAEYQRLKEQSQTTKILELNEIQEAKNNKGMTLKEVNRRNRALMLELNESGRSISEISEITGLEQQTVMNYLTKARKEREGNEHF